MVPPAPFQWVHSFSFPFKHLAINPHSVVLCCCRSWRQGFCFKYFVTYQYLFAKCLISQTVECAFPIMHSNDGFLSCFDDILFRVTALGNLFNISIALVKLLSAAIFLNAIPFPYSKILDVVSHPKIACSTSIFLHMSMPNFS